MRLSCWQGFFFFFPEDYKEESASESPLDFGGLLANKKKFLLDYGGFTTLCCFLLYTTVNQVHIYIHPLVLDLFRFRTTEL